MFDKLCPNQKSRIPVPRVQQGNGTSPGTSPGSSSSATSMVPNASTTDPVAGASMLGSLRGTTRVEGCRLSAAGRDISFNTYNMNCAHLSAENGKLPDEIHLRRQRAEAEARTIDNERAQIVKNTAQQKATKQGFAGGNINGAIWLPRTPEECAIYVRNLLHKGHGWPFYIPGPSKRLPIAYRKEGMRCGDVGIINMRGSFEFLFNICHPADDPINDQGVPKHFEQLQIHTNIQEHSEFNGNSYICSPSIRNSSGLKFESSASEGAILAMPVGAISEDVTNVLTFKKYASTHAEHWYRYIKSCGRDVENGDVRLVTGYHKTSRWCIATFSDSTANEQPFHLEFNHVTETNMGKMYEWKHSGTAQVRTGPGAQEIEDLDPGHEGRHYQNQSLFGRTISATLKEDIWNELAEEFDEVEIDDDSMDDAPESSNQGSTGSRRANSSTTPSTSASPNAPGQRSLAMINNISTDPTIRLVSGFHQEATLPYHPSNAINKMLLELCPNARVAITSDNDWMSILQKDDLTPPSNEELCARIKVSLVIRQDEDAVFLENPESSDARIMQKDHLLLCAASFTGFSPSGDRHPREYIRSHKQEIEAWDRDTWRKLFNSFKALSNAWEMRRNELKEKVGGLQAQLRYAGYAGYYNRTKIEQEYERMKWLLNDAQSNFESVATSKFQFGEVSGGYRQSRDMSSKGRVREATNAALQKLPGWPLLNDAQSNFESTLAQQHHQPDTYQQYPQIHQPQTSTVYFPQQSQRPFQQQPQNYPPPYPQSQSHSPTSFQPNSAFGQNLQASSSSYGYLQSGQHQPPPQQDAYNQARQQIENYIPEFDPYPISQSQADTNHIPISIPRPFRFHQ